jgi:hypothetical protein
MSAQDSAWAGVAIPDGLGLEVPRYKFLQNQSHVQAFLRLPSAAAAKKVRAPGWTVLRRARLVQCI